MTGPRITRRRWLAGAVAAVVGLAVAGFLESRGRAEWIGEVPPAEYSPPERQIFMKADLDAAVDDTLRDLQAEIRDALENAGVKVTWIATKAPDYRFAVDDPHTAERALQIARLAIPGAELEVADTEIRIRLVDTFLDRIRYDGVLKTASHLQYRVGVALRMNRDDVEGRRPEINVYVHESGCVRVDGIGRREIPRHIMGRQPRMELVPLYPTLDAGSDHLPQGFSSLRIERNRKPVRPANDREQGTVLEALMHWKSPPEADPEDEWRHIVAGRPIVTNSHFVNAEMIQGLQGPAVSLRLDVVGKARAARLLPAYQGRQFGLVLDNAVVGQFNTVTISDDGVTLWPDRLVYEARLVVDLLNGMAVPPALEYADACPAAGNSR